eukprot:CAMPEP_0178783600 /NCGR_PEP_ID=MMETSP0745-20121128/3775_1 /TAXON_ID=913974 /ORGANISM="Nitzschia punctata, Strain CCMP561" /LENGTH=89 /DNA_ID=CAMNT_0020441129 /DNA_START=164 /DNA_END=433 /DNA_ORIENTATION=+
MTIGPIDRENEDILDGLIDSLTSDATNICRPVISSTHAAQRHALRSATGVNVSSSTWIMRLSESYVISGRLDENFALATSLTTDFAKSR